MTSDTPITTTAGATVLVEPPSATTGSVELTIPTRFCGPPGMGNGGWVAGSLAARLPGGPVEVTLRSPAPLDRPLRVSIEGGAVRLWDGATLCAEAVRVDTVAGPVPDPVDAAVASEATERFAGRSEHPFPTCFVCGTERAPDDALRIFAGPVADRPGVVAATWVPSAALEFDDGTIPSAAIWAALDCPTGWAHYEPGGVALLGRHTLAVHHPVVTGETYVVVAEPGHRDGRKLHANAALYGPGGTVHAHAHALWITLT